MKKYLGYIVAFLFLFGEINCNKPAIVARTYTIAASTIGNGTISPPGVSTVDSSRNLTLVLMPASSHHVDSVYVDNVKRDSLKSYEFNNVTSNHVVVAFFSVDRIILTSSAVGDGSVNPSGTVAVDAGGSQRFTFIANRGSHVDSVYVDNRKVDSLSSYTLHNVLGYHNTTAYFGIGNNAVRFNDGEGSIRIPPFSDLRLQQLTVEMFVQINNDDTAIVPLLCQTNIDQWSYADGFGVKWEEGNLCFTVATQSNNCDAVSAPYSFKPGEWVHVACTYDHEVLRLYVNGNILAEKPYTDNIYYGNNGFDFGSVNHSQFGGQRYLHGMMDEVRIWSYARTPDQINQAMKTKLTGNENGLVGYWDCDQEMGSRYLNDRTGFHHRGIIKGNLTFVPSNAFKYNP